MPIGFKKQPFTLQEKVDKAMELTYQISDIGDSEFMRSFLLELIDKAFRKLIQERHGDNGIPTTADELNVANQIENLKRLQE